jgi:hypothetical protein
LRQPKIGPLRGTSLQTGHSNCSRSLSIVSFRNLFSGFSSGSSFTFFVPCSSIRCLKLVPLDVDRSALPDSEPKQLREDHPSSHSFLALMLSIEIYKAKFLIFLTNSSNGYFKPLSKMKTRICNFINS